MQRSTKPVPGVRTRGTALPAGLLAVFLLFTIGACRSAPEARPAPASCEPEIRLMRRAVEVVPLVVTSPLLEPSVLSDVRRAFERQLTGSGVFEVVNGQERQGELVITGVISDAGAIPGETVENFSVADAAATDLDWALRLVVEVRAKSDNHLIAVVGGAAHFDMVVAQATQAKIEKQIPDPWLRRGLMQVLAQAAANLAARFGPGASFEDPAKLDDDTLVRLGTEHYSAGAYYDAEALLRTVRDRKTASPLVVSLLGDIYYTRRDYVNAVAMYNAAIDLEANRFHDLVLLGNASYFLLDQKRARKVWEQALRLDPRGPHARTLRANLRLAREGSRKPGRGRGLGSSPAKGRGGSDSTRLADDEF